MDINKWFIGTVFDTGLLYKSQQLVYMNSSDTGLLYGY